MNLEGVISQASFYWVLVIIAFLLLYIAFKQKSPEKKK